MANKHNDRVRNNEKENRQLFSGAYEQLMQQLDTDSLKTEKAINDYIDQSFQDMTRKSRKFLHFFSAESSMSPEFLARRKLAMKAYIPTIREKFAAKYPDIDVVKEFIGMNSVLCRGYENLEYSRALSVAAAIWILDELKRNGQIVKGIRCTPSDPEKYYQIQLPDGFCDAAHEETVIQSMTYAIQKRNADPGRKKKNQDIIDNELAFMHSITPFRKVTEYTGCNPPEDLLENSKRDAFYDNLTNRQRFDTIMSLIPKVKIERAVQRFEKAVMDYLDLFFQTIEERSKNHHRLVRDTMNDMKAFEEGRIRQTHMLKPMGPVMTAPQNVPFTPGIPGSPMFWKKGEDTDPMALLKKIDSKVDALKAHDMEQHGYWLLMPCCYSVDRIDREMVADTIHKEHLAIMEQLKIDNPYEICFAFLYLLDTGADLPWLYNIGYAVLNRAGHMLPWGYMQDVFGDEYDDDYEEEEDDSAEEINDETESDTAEDTEESDDDWYDRMVNHPEDTIEDESKLYDRIYTDAYDNEDLSEQGVPALPMSLAQVVYDQTSVVLPRDLFINYKEREQFEKAGFTKESSEILVRMLQMAERMQNRTRDWRGVIPDDIADEIVDETEEPAETVETDDKDEQIHKLKVEVDRLKNAYYEIHRERNELKRSIEQAEEDADRDHQELVDLRELVFNLEHNDLAESTEDEIDFAFPYETQKRMVVFGGHDTWVKAIKPMLPTVRFIDKDMKPNADLIRKADIVWIQPNAISHAYYYNIMDVARAHKKQVHYFATASAERCARQLAVQDQKD